MKHGVFKSRRYIAAVLVGTAFLTALSTAGAATKMVDGIQVKYNRDSYLWDAFYNPSTGALQIEISGSARDGGTLTVIATKDAPHYWAEGYADVDIYAGYVEVGRLVFKGSITQGGRLFPLFICGDFETARSLSLKGGCVGLTDAWGPFFGLHQWDFKRPKKISMKHAYSIASVCGPVFLTGKERPSKNSLEPEVWEEAKGRILQMLQAEVDETEEVLEDEEGQAQEKQELSEAEVSPGDTVAFFQELLRSAK